MGRYSWKPYVPVARRRALAERASAKMRRSGAEVRPVRIEGRDIARTFWGRAWCDHLESFSDYENRLPRGRSYVRNGSVCHLEIRPGMIRALVQGSRLYTVSIGVAPLSRTAWKRITGRCTGSIGSLLDLLQGRLSAGVMAVVTDRQNGLFPAPRQIEIRCSCPDWATMCKHVAAALYGVGARLDEQPELLFLLRGVDHRELANVPLEAAITAAVGRGTARRIADADLAEVFGVDLGSANDRPVTRPRAGGGGARPAAPPPLSDRITGGVVRSLRARLGMNQREFARLLGVSPATVSVWERSKSALRIHRRGRAALSMAWGASAPRGGKQRP